jgi:phage head maturation protease
MPAIDVDVVRSLITSPELRSDSRDDSLGVLAGHFSTFNNWYRIASAWEGEFLERTAPGFSTQTLTANRDSMRCQFDHGFDTQIGSKALGTFRELREDDQGAYYEVDLFDTSYNRDLLPGFRAGSYGSSFRMKVQDDAWNDKPVRSEYNPNGIPERTILRADVSELGPVAWPANPSATAKMRSSTDEFYSRLQQRDRGAFEAACRAANINIPDFVAQRGGHDGEHDSGPAAQSQSIQRRRGSLHRKLKRRGIL